MKAALYAFLFILTFSRAFAQEMDVLPPPSKNDIVEITTTDFTKIDSFKAKNARVFGIGLGMTEAQIEKIPIYDQRIYIEQDKLNGQRRYIYDNCIADNDTADVVLGYLKWNEGDSGLAEIVLYDAIWQFVSWQSSCCDLFSCETLKPESVLYSNFFGKPLKKKVVLNIPSINLTSIQYFYPDHNMIITENTDGDMVTYTLSFVRKMDKY